MTDGINKLYAIGHAHLYTVTVTTEIAETEQQAIQKMVVRANRHNDKMQQWAEELPEDIENIKQKFIERGELIGINEVTSFWVK